ncbi:putative ABC transport system permease protein [Paenibacillus cellulosilyticus]|uniref:Putative hemin transport system permease protein HrtB n=1 Tax=Paenibacillus cellulosilyticus TaxID=375489 RepID=A0A2V2YXP6_9BACL|nr:ABC transporter permease [Paenibacillus cellulosilyticus]PWW02930.1 putative ABC transport system permease protein [Paenibacillus cellulosilyticus]QKS45838.1 ABC transporter permease [Paenibacillus cellulosilyticus]
MYLAIREMRFAKVRYALIATIMLLIAFLVLFVTGLAKGLAYDNAASIENMSASHFVMEKEASHRFTRSLLEESVLSQTGKAIGEENVQSLSVRMTTVTNAGAEFKLDVTLIAVKPEGWLMPSVSEGHAITSQSIGEVLVDSKMKESGIGIGSIIVDQGSGLEWTVSGFVSDESFSHSPVIFLNESDWRQLQLKMNALKGADGAASDRSISAIALRADKEQVEQLAAAMSQTEIVTKSQAIAAIPGYKEEQGSLTMMILFLYIISVFVLAVFFYVITIQKSHQFGVLKAIGTRTGYLVKSVSLQMLLLSVSSLMISVLLVRAIEMMLPSGMPFQLHVSTLLMTCGAFIVISLVGALLSVYKISRIDALDAIGRTTA